MSSTPLDPFALWREMLGQWERSANSLANQAMGSDEVARAAHALSTVALRLQEATQDVVATSLRALNLPTREDVMGLHDRLARIEARLEQLQQAQAVRATPPAAHPPADSVPARPARTRKPAGKDHAKEGAKNRA